MFSKDPLLFTWRSMLPCLFKNVGWKWLHKCSKPRSLDRSMSKFSVTSLKASDLAMRKTCLRKSLCLQAGPQKQTNVGNLHNCSLKQLFSQTTCPWVWKSIFMALSLGMIVIMHHYCGNSWLSSIVIHSHRLKVKENKKIFIQ